MNAREGIKTDYQIRTSTRDYLTRTSTRDYLTRTSADSSFNPRSRGGSDYLGLMLFGVGYSFNPRSHGGATKLPAGLDIITVEGCNSGQT